MLYNILAEKKIKVNKLEDIIHLTPLIDIIDLEDIQIESNYRLWLNNPIVTAKNSHGLFSFNCKKDAIKLLKDKSYLIWSIIYNSNNKMLPIHIGNVSLQNINLINRSAEIACVIGEVEYWGNGFMTWACENIIEHGFLKLGLNRIWSGTAATNKGMRAVFQKLRFKVEGQFREGMFLDGKFEDVFAYGLLNSDWQCSYKNALKRMFLKNDEPSLRSIVV